jgi:cell division protein FtsW (lipid II flippase)
MRGGLMSSIIPVAPRPRRNVELALLLIAVAIVLLAYAQVGMAMQDEVPPDLIWYGAGLLGLSGAIHLVLRLRAKYADPVLLPAATLLNGLGLVMIHRLDLAHPQTRSGTDAYALRQLVWSAIGVLGAIAVLWVIRDHRVLRRYTYIAMVVSLGLLVLPLLPGLGKTINGSRIWIGLGPLSFQPGEIAKITLAVFFAGYLVTHRDVLSLVGPRFLGIALPRGRDLGPIIVVWLASLGVLVFERDLGSSLLFFGLFVAMLYVATERRSWIVIGLGLFGAGCYAAYLLFGHVHDRVDIWLHAFDPSVLNKPFGGSYQIVQGLYGMAAGGMFGAGLGQGRPSMIPFAESDFIVPAFGEELGLVGLFALLLIYGLIVERGLRTSIGVRDGFGKLLAAGLAFSVALQCFVVVGGVTRLIPLTGLTMPFLSHGGSSLLANWSIIALLLRISDHARRPAPEALPLPVGDEATQAVKVR